ncbi:MAG: hypothetical protein ABIP90_07185 [Vicinamibacterales bacterium]
MKCTGLAVGLLAAIFGAACSGTPLTAPSASKANSLLGTWASVSDAPSTAGTCANFQWAVTDVSGLTGSGTFSATCFGTLQVTGTGSGTFAGTSIDWKLNGTGTGSGTGSCAISASGSASLTSDGGILIPYSGTTCLGPVSGTQIIRKR